MIAESDKPHLEGDPTPLPATDRASRVRAAITAAVAAARALQIELLGARADAEEARQAAAPSPTLPSTVS